MIRLLLVFHLQINKKWINSSRVWVCFLSNHQENLSKIPSNCKFLIIDYSFIRNVLNLQVCQPTPDPPTALTIKVVTKPLKSGQFLPRKNPSQGILLVHPFRRRHLKTVERPSISWIKNSIKPNWVQHILRHTGWPEKIFTLLKLLPFYLYEHCRDV